MTPAARFFFFAALLNFVVACGDDPDVPEGPLSADASDASIIEADASLDDDAAVDVADAMTEDSGPIVIVPALIDFCGDGLDQDADGTPDDTCNRVFVATIPYSIATYGASGHLLDATDGACAAAASAAGLDGEFVAYVSSPVIAARARLGAARGFVRVDGKPVADTVAELASGRIRYPIAFAANGANAPDTVLTASNSSGQYDASASCSGMTDFAGGTVAVGVPRAGGTSFQSNGGLGCNASSFSVYCVEVDHQTPLAAPTIPANAHRVFVSASTVPSGGGLASADAVCNVEADAAGLPGAYVALLPTNAASAASRIANDGDPVVRPDGVVVAPTTQAFIARFWNAPLAITATGAPFVGATGMWVAAPNPFTESDGNCNDYTSKSAALTTTTTLVNFIWGEASVSTLNCDTVTQRVVCIAP